MKRLTELLDLSAKETELFLSKLVVSKTIYARIDRVDGMVTFNKPRTSNEIVDNWSNDVNELLKSVAESMHLISKEEMVHTIAKVGTSV